MISASCSSTDFITAPNSKGTNLTRSEPNYKFCPAFACESVTDTREGLLRAGFGYILYSYFIFIM
ncbi:hypothetical protein GIV92_26570, partial [Pseudomonas syringae]|nr:hypothetical protein [Pseudomonas syringae]